MSKKIKDTDYLTISARIRAMENNLLTKDKMEQILDARSIDDAAKIIQECGYPPFSMERPEEMDAALSAMRESVFQDLGSGLPDARYLDIFKLKYDYHNIKALLKAEAMNANPASMLMDMGRIPAAELQAAVSSGELDTLPEMLAAAITEAKEVLDSTRDPQLSDIVLDRWCYRDMMALADGTGSRFLMGYVSISIDAANLKALVRTLRMGKNADFLRNVLLEGGEVDTSQIAEAASSGNLTDLYRPTALADAADAGAAALKGGTLTEFEKLCDNAVQSYLDNAQYVPFGEEPLVGYLAARETEYTNLRIILLGRKAGLAPEVIRSRLRTGYV